MSSNQPHNHMAESRYRALDVTDGMSPALRECVHEFGYPIVSTFVNSGITKPNLIRALIHTCWMGAREVRQRHGVIQGASPVAAQLDWILLQSGSQISALTLLRVLDLHGMCIVPKYPSEVMVHASMDAIKDMGPLTKPAKHRHRLRAAIKAASQRLWPRISETQH